MIFTIILILCFLTVGYLIVNLLYKRTNAYKNDLIPYDKFCSDIPQNLRIAILGSTYSLFAFNGIKDLQLNAYNFALPSQSLEIDNVLLRKYASHLDKGAVVVFCLAACVSYYRFDLVTNKKPYFLFMRKKEIPSFSLIDYFKYHFPLYGKGIKKAVRLFFDVPPKVGLYTNFSPSVPYEETRKNMRGMAEGWINLFKLKDLKHENQDSLNKSNLSYNTSLLNSMFRFCQSRSLCPVVVIPPFSSELNQYFDNEFVDCSLIKMIKEAKEDMLIPVLDYRTNEIFQHNSSLYVDGGFRLNNHGSKKFIRMVLHELSLKGYCLTNETIGIG